MGDRTKPRARSATDANRPQDESTERIVERLEELYQIGASSAGEGANRPGLSPAEQQAHDLATRWMKEAGLAVSVDRAGNLVGRWPGENLRLSEVWTGSHLDSVPNAGRFDGALGVVAGIDAVAVAGRAKRRHRTLAVVAFRDEEGCRFGQGFFGSRAIGGGLEPGELDLCDAAGVSISQALAALGVLDPLGAGDPACLPGTFVELHLEQGSTLADRGLAVGVVSEIVAMAGLEAHFVGERAHAGGASMHERRDALVAGARFVIATNEVATSRQDCRATVGELSIRDAAANVVANEVVARVDVRARSDHGLDALVDALTTAGLAAGRQSRCRASVETVWRRRAVAMDSQVRGVLRPVAARATDGATAHDVETSSWAGHDAGILRAAGVQVGMLFVRSGRGGVSHSPHETVALSDVASGVAALAEALGQLAE